MTTNDSQPFSNQCLGLNSVDHCSLPKWSFILSVLCQTNELLFSSTSGLRRQRILHCVNIIRCPTLFWSIHSRNDHSLKSCKVFKRAHEIEIVHALPSHVAEDTTPYWPDHLRQARVSQNFPNIPPPPPPPLDTTLFVRGLLSEIYFRNFET